MEPSRCRRILLRLLFGLTFCCLVFFIIVCVLNLKPYLESQNYVNTSCIMDSKDQYAAETGCHCGRGCRGTQSCGAAYVNVPSTGVKHALINLDESETSHNCTSDDDECHFPFSLDKLPPVGANFSCFYDPDNHNRVIWHHQTKGFLLPMLIVPACLFVIFLALSCGFCCYYQKKGLSISSGDTNFRFSRFNNQAI